MQNCMWQIFLKDALWQMLQRRTVPVCSEEEAMNHWSDIAENEQMFCAWSDQIPREFIQMMENSNSLNFLPFYIIFHFLFNKSDNHFQGIFTFIESGNRRNRQRFIKANFVINLLHPTNYILLLQTITFFQLITIDKNRLSQT